MKVKNILFDWSGTISNDLPLVYATVMKTFDHFNTPRVSLEEFREEFTLPYMDHMKKFGITASQEEVDKIFIDNFRDSGFPTPFPDAADVLSQLSSRNINMAVLSSHIQAFLEEEADRFFVDHKRFFTHIFGSVQDKEEAIGDVLSIARFEAKDTLIVGDAEHDIAAGKKAGIKTAAILTGYTSREKLLATNPDFVLNSLSELLQHL